MQNHYINFKRKRDLGQVISDTFKFLRRNFKFIFKVLIRTCLVPFIIVLLAISFYTYETAGIDYLNSSDDVNNLLLIFLSAVLFVTSIIYFSSMLNGSISSCIKFYDREEGSIPISDTVHYIKTNTGRFIGLGFLQALYIGGIAILSATIFGLIIFTGSGNIFLAFLLIFVIIIPTTYLYIRYSLVFPILVHSESTVSGSFVKSASYIKDYWWITFATIFIMGILVSVIGSIFQIPAVIYVAIKTFTAVQETNLSDSGALMDPLGILLQVLGSGAQYFLYIIPAISINFIAFDLNERKNQTGVLEQIDRLGE